MPAPQAPLKRLHSLDALRAAMMLLGLVLHSVVSYITIAIPEAWPYQDRQTSVAFDYLVFAIHLFRMPTFFVMAGFFAAAAKTPFSTLVIVCEITGDFRLLAPALGVCVGCFVLSGPASLFESQPASWADSPVHHPIGAPPSRENKNNHRFPPPGSPVRDRF